MSEKRAAYSEETLDWFDKAWTMGISATRIQDGIAERGHILTSEQLAGLADRRGLNRPLGYRAGGRTMRQMFDDAVQRRLSRPPPLAEDNAVVKPEHTFTYPGGYRMGARR